MGAFLPWTPTVAPFSEKVKDFNRGILPEDRRDQP